MNPPHNTGPGCPQCSAGQSRRQSRSLPEPDASVTPGLCMASGDDLRDARWYVLGGSAVAAFSSIVRSSARSPLRSRRVRRPRGGSDRWRRVEAMTSNSSSIDSGERSRSMKRRILQQFDRGHDHYANPIEEPRSCCRSTRTMSRLCSPSPRSYPTAGRSAQRRVFGTTRPAACSCSGTACCSSSGSAEDTFSPRRMRRAESASHSRRLRVVGVRIRGTGLMVRRARRLAAWCGAAGAAVGTSRKVPSVPVPAGQLLSVWCRSATTARRGSFGLRARSRSVGRGVRSPSAGTATAG